MKIFGKKKSKEKVIVTVEDLIAEIMKQNEERAQKEREDSTK